MTDKGGLSKADAHLPSSSSSSFSQQAMPDATRPRRRGSCTSRLARDSSRTSNLAEENSVSLDSRNEQLRSQTTSRASNLSRRESCAEDMNAGNDLAQFLGDSWNQSWSSVQAFASTLIPVNGNQSHTTRPNRRRSEYTSQPSAWGPAPSPRTPMMRAIAMGSPAQREAAVRAAKTARVLESHEGVNGGLKFASYHKRRNSEEIKTGESPPEDHLVYIHKVQPSDTYAGIILRYRCREDVFRRFNGLWSRDSVQMRKWLIIPVDACELRGRPCQSPSSHDEPQSDLLAPTPPALEASSSDEQIGESSLCGPQTYTLAQPRVDHDRHKECDTPWIHVRWVQIDSFKDPVQIARVSRQTSGYFPPRRKKSSGTISSMSTPRQSSDLSSLPPGPNERSSSRHTSSLGTSQAAQAILYSQSGRQTEEETTDSRPGWMRRPGGVGSMNKTVTTPGPEKDYLNSWAKKHLPGLNIESLPSMAIMGSETAHFGFGERHASIVESPLQQGRETLATSRHGNGLDRAAAAVEHWLRGALARRPSILQVGRVKSFGSSSAQDTTDLIELAEAPTEDGRSSQDDAHSAAERTQDFLNEAASDGHPTKKSRKTSGRNSEGSRQKSE